MRLIRFVGVVCGLVCIASGPALTEIALGPLKVCDDNPRYFEDVPGHAILLTGSHVWYNLVDMGATDPPEAFDYDAFLDWLVDHNHNFIRMWTWDLTRWKWREVDAFVAPLPYARTGPGLALDGKPRFDLESFDEVYFSRLQERIDAARRRGIYVSVMLFEGWGLQFADDAWKSHPYHPANNINDTGRWLDAASDCLAIYTLDHPEVTALQERYVRHVIDAVNDLDNVLYEISNENHPPSTAWQYHLIDYVHAYERSLPKQHPVGMTFQHRGGSLRALFESPAEWVSPNGEDGYREQPPAANGRKVILSDTDHLWGIGGNREWVWKSFFSGLNPIFMDPYDGRVLDEPFNPKWEPIRVAMGQARAIASRANLTLLTPRPALASSGYCLANPGVEYLVYVPKEGLISLDLGAVSGIFGLEWINPRTGERHADSHLKGGETRTFGSPFGDGDAVMHVVLGQ